MTKKKLYILAIVAVVVALIVEVTLSHPHVYFIWHSIPGFNIIFGFVGAWLLIGVAKFIVGPLLQRREDYYDGGDDDDE